MATEIIKTSCIDCLYYQHNQINGVCRRYPSYQNRLSTEWCGEFLLIPQPKPIEQIKPKKAGRQRKVNHEEA